MRTICLTIMAATMLALGTGCSPDLLGQDPDDFKNLSYSSLTIGTNSFELPAGSATQFEVEVVAGQDIQIIATPLGDAILGIGYAKSPDDYVFSAYPGAEQRSTNGRFRVGPQRVGASPRGIPIPRSGRRGRRVAILDSGAAAAERRDWPGDSRARQRLRKTDSVYLPGRGRADPAAGVCAGDVQTRSPNW